MIWQAIDGIVCCFGVPILPFIHTAEEIYCCHVVQVKVILIKQFFQVLKCSFRWWWQEGAFTFCSYPRGHANNMSLT